MWISKKRLKELLTRIERLEQAQRATSWEFGEVTFQEFVRKMPSYVDKRIKRAQAVAEPGRKTVKQDS